ncbi:hypothetical protein HY477_04025 [Candidatus Uhrbacteria bacterium]|nr:hypothetical protein [Candidatus Uhrbacteria bacterium]
MKTWLKAGAATALWALPLAVLAQDLDLGIEYGTLTGLGTKDLRETVASIINVALSLLGIVAVVIILAGGFMWMTAAGNEEKLEKAKQLIFGGIIGLAIILSAYAIARFVISSLVEATTS